MRNYLDSGIYKNAKYKITVTSSDGENQVTYVVNIAKIKSGASVFLIVIIIIILSKQIPISIQQYSLNLL